MPRPSRFRLASAAAFTALVCGLSPKTARAVVPITAGQTVTGIAAAANSEPAGAPSSPGP